MTGSPQPPTLFTWTPAAEQARSPPSIIAPPPPPVSFRLPPSPVHCGGRRLRCGGGCRGVPAQFKSFPSVDFSPVACLLQKATMMRVTNRELLVVELASEEGRHCRLEYIQTARHLNPRFLKDSEAPSHHSSSRRWRSRSQSLLTHLRRCHEALGETCTPLARHVSVFLVFFPHLVDPFLFLSSWQADPDNQPAQYRPACLNCLAACHSLVLQPHSPSLDKPPLPSALAA